jgi:crossover junction endodeoxyribonuclease RuvC
MSITIGVDPGLTGAFALVDSYGGLIDAYDMPTLNKDVSAQLVAELEDWNQLSLESAVVVIEDVHSMPKQGVASSFKFGRSKGVVEGVFAGAGLSLRYVAPSTWKRDLKLSKNKGASRQLAVELWPSKTSLFTRAKDDGRAEAALIAYWYQQHGERRGAA